MYELGVTIDMCDGVFFRTKLIRFTPRFVVRNAASGVVQLRQRTSKTVMLTLAPGEQRAMHWSDASAPLEAEVSLRGLTNWSRALSFDCAGDVATAAKLLLGVRVVDGVPQAPVTPGGREQSEFYLIGLRIRFNVATFEIEVHDQAESNPPYRLENCTPLGICFFQGKKDRFWGCFFNQKNKIK